MKVIGQLIAYFRSHGSLSDDQIEYLTRQGFIAASEDGADDTIIEDESYAPAPIIQQVDEDDHKLESVTPRRRNRGGTIRKGPVLEPAELTGWLDEQFPIWAPTLSGLEQVARQLKPCDGYYEATIVIRQASRDDLRQSLLAGLRSQALSLKAVWESLGFDHCHEVLKKYSFRGPAVSAYRAILASTDLSQIAKHVWLLKDRSVSAVYNVLQSQRRIARALGEVFDEDPPLLSAAMRRESHPLAFWSMVLAYNAARGDGPHGSLAQREYGPLVWLGDDLVVSKAVITLGEDGPRCGPDYDLWMRAWSLALLMQPDRVTPFFAASVQSDDPTPLMCPAGWKAK